jgi:hypothetical protein
MGKVSTASFVIGLMPLVLAIFLTVVLLFFPWFTPEMAWFNSYVKAIVVGVLYLIALAFIILGFVIAKRDLE